MKEIVQGNIMFFFTSPPSLCPHTLYRAQNGLLLQHKDIHELHACEFADHLDKLSRAHADAKAEEFLRISSSTLTSDHILAPVNI